MKLRLRSFETKETLKLEVPNPCSLPYLKELVFQKLPSPSRSSDIYFSLNRKDDLTTSDPEGSIQSIGITSGDLIYFTTNPTGFSPVPIATHSRNSQTLNPDSGKRDETLNTGKGKTVDSSNFDSGNRDETLNPGKGKTVDSSNSDSGKQEETLTTGKGKTVDIGSPDSEDVLESMEIDDDENSVSEVGKSFSVPGFLRKVFTEELGDDNGLNHKLLVTAVRAVLLESGFVEIDPVSKLLKGINVNVQGNWYLPSYYYSLPNIISTSNIETVKIKFQNLGKYCKVYGTLVNGPEVHSVLIDEDKLVPFLNVVWANCGQVVETMEENNRVSSVQPEKEVFEFWRKMKDGLALPLLIDLCEKAGLELPPCFMRLPTELKLKIFESVSGVDIAKVSCVCSELRYLASSDDLWKQKYVEQFGNVEGSGNGRSFKERFATVWEGRKRRRVVGRSSFGIMRRRNPYAPFGLGHFPRIIGGDYDLLPNLAPTGPRGLPGVGGGGPRLRNVMPNCNLGGLDL